MKFVHYFCSLKAEETAGEYLNPLKILHRLEEKLSDDSIIVADGGDFVGSAAYILRFVCIYLSVKLICSFSKRITLVVCYFKPRLNISTICFLKIL